MVNIKLSKNSLILCGSESGHSSNLERSNKCCGRIFKILGCGIINASMHSLMFFYWFDEYFFCFSFSAFAMQIGTFAIEKTRQKKEIYKRHGLIKE